jgi:hypothetical protein
MAFTYGCYNYDKNDPDDDQKIYDAEQIGQIFDGIITDGVYANVGKHFGVSAPLDSTESTVFINTGRAWLKHTWNLNDSIYIMTAPAPPSFNDRIDALVIDVDNANRHNGFEWVIGTEAETPERPALIKLADHRQYPIAYVNRQANNRVITNSDITNVVGTADTPYVTGESQNYIVHQQILRSGSTSVTFPNVEMSNRTRIEVGASIPGLDYDDMSVSGDSITITYGAQSQNVMIYLIATEV